MILKYENASGATGVTPEHWPAGIRIPLDTKHDTLIMFAHPQCSCTRASIEELNRLLTKCDGRITAHVLFLKPPNFPDSWSQTDLWRSASAIPGVTVQEDPEGLIAQKFGAETSGFVLLYDPSGQLLFHGGITGSRGHAGDNTGEEAIIALATGENPGVKHTLVYGCSLLNESRSDPICSQCLSNESSALQNH